MAPIPESPAARLSLVAGALALALAILGPVLTPFLDPGVAVRILRILLWVVAGLAVVGILLGLASGMRGAGRTGTLLSVVTGLLLAAFVTYSGFGTPAATDSTPTGATTAPATGG